MGGTIWTVIRDYCIRLSKYSPSLQRIANAISNSRNETNKPSEKRHFYPRKTKCGNPARARDAQGTADHRLAYLDFDTGELWLTKNVGHS